MPAEAETKKQCDLQHRTSERFRIWQNLLMLNGGVKANLKTEILVKSVFKKQPGKILDVCSLEKANQRYSGLVDMVQWTVGGYHTEKRN